MNIVSLKLNATLVLQSVSRPSSVGVGVGVKLFLILQIHQYYASKLDDMLVDSQFEEEKFDNPPF
jgi:hypothetical protein